MCLCGDNMLIKNTLKEYLIQHSKDGEWSGADLNGVPVITTHLGVEPAEPYLNQLGIKLAKSNKYTVREENAGMGEIKSSGDTGDTGNGISQSKE
jgi:hypothetical protein